MNIMQSTKIQNILSMKISVVDLNTTVFIVKNNVDNLNTSYVCCVPAHSIMDCYDHPELLPVFNNSYLNTPDGMAVVWILKLLGHKEVGRVYGPDLMNELCRVSLESGYKHFFYGNTASVLSDLKEKLKEKYSGITDDDLFFGDGKEKEMIEMLGYKLGKTKDELTNIITAL